MDTTEEQGFEDGFMFEGGKKGRLFIVDYGEHMFADNQWRFRLALQTVRDQINKACCTGDMNECGAVVFINTGETKAERPGIEYIFVHRTLGVFDADYVKQLDGLLAQGDLMKGLEPELGETAVCDWSDVVLLCQDMLQSMRKKVINIFTTDNTEFFDPTILMGAKKRVLEELRPKNVEIKVFLLEEEREEENEFTKFLKEIDPELSRYTKFDELREGLHFKNYALRSTTSLPFILGDGLQFAVGLYYLIRPQGKPPAILMDSETNEKVEQRIHYVPKDVDIEAKNAIETTTADLLPGAVEEEVFEGEVNFARDVGGVGVVLNREEREKLRRFDRPGITVIGFKPMRLLKDSHRMSPAKFIHPLDTVIRGSATIYRSLLRKCLDRDLFILVRYTQKTNTPPQVCALVPQSAEGKEGNPISHYIYEGFHMVELPFAEEARNLRDRYSTPKGIDAWPLANREQVDAAKEFIKKNTANFTPDQFANPVLQRHYKAVETVALDLDADTFIGEAEKLDALQPYFKHQANVDRVAAQVAKLKELCWSREEEGGGKLAAAAAKGRPQKVKKEEVEEEDELVEQQNAGKPPAKRGRKAKA